MLPLSAVVSDARRNLVAAVLLASMASTPKEVSIFMVRHHLSRWAAVFMSYSNSVEVLRMPRRNLGLCFGHSSACDGPRA